MEKLFKEVESISEKIAWLKRYKEAHLRCVDRIDEQFVKIKKEIEEVLDDING